MSGGSCGLLLEELLLVVWKCGRVRSTSADAGSASGHVLSVWLSEWPGATAGCVSPVPDGGAGNDDDDDDDNDDDDDDDDDGDNCVSPVVLLGPVVSCG